MDVKAHFVTYLQTNYTFPIASISHSCNTIPTLAFTSKAFQNIKDIGSRWKAVTHFSSGDLYHVD